MTLDAPIIWFLSTDGRWLRKTVTKESGDRSSDCHASSRKGFSAPSTQRSGGCLPCTWKYFPTGLRTEQLINPLLQERYDSTPCTPWDPMTKHSTETKSLPVSAMLLRARFRSGVKGSLVFCKLVTETKSKEGETFCGCLSHIQLLSLLAKQLLSKDALHGDWWYPASMQASSSSIKLRPRPQGPCANSYGNEWAPEFYAHVNKLLFLDFQLTLSSTNSMSIKSLYFVIQVIMSPN